MKKVLVVGQTPPPYGGQAIMIQYMLDATYTEVELYHVRMCFSKEFSDRGKFSFYKIWHVFQIIINIWKLRFKKGIEMMYYPVSSSPKIAVIRDAAILACTRFLFKEVLFHFHAAGISEELPKYNPLLRSIVFGILKRPNICITSSEFNPRDGEFLKARKVFILPLGIPDENPTEERRGYGRYAHLTVLFMGLLNGTKGEGYVLDAIKRLNEGKRDVRFVIAGKFESDEYRQQFEHKIIQYGLAGKVTYKGVITGADKKNAFLESDVFCFPSFFESESFGIVLLEAMMYQMPIIASKWRGIQSVVEAEKNGFLVDIKNSSQIEKVLIRLYDDRILLKKMAIESRKLYKEKYKLGTYIKGIENIMLFNNK